MRNNSKQEQKKTPTCTVCMQRPSNCSLNGCSHLFCLRCIKKWSRTKNSCPLCRERFTRLQCKSKVIEVQPVAQRVRPARVPVEMQPFHQRRLIYLPLLIYPQSGCFFYPPQAGFFMHSSVPGTAPLRYSMNAPAFFMPSV